MKFTYLLSAAFLMLSLQLNLHAQGVIEGVEELPKKEKGNALSITVEGEEKNVQTVMDQIFKEGTGGKIRSKSGMRIAQGARFGEISSKDLDYSYKVEKASRNDKLHSKVTLFISAGNGNYLSSEEFPKEIEAATELLEGLQLEVRIYEMELLIEDQEKLISKEEKDYENLQSDSVKLEEVLLETQAALEQNKVDQADKRSKIATEQERLSAFRLQLDELRNKKNNPGEILDEEVLDALDEEILDDSDDDGGR